jgi:hypothetical protein
MASCLLIGARLPRNASRPRSRPLKASYAAWDRFNCHCGAGRATARTLSPPRNSLLLRKHRVIVALRRLRFQVFATPSFRDAWLRTLSQHSSVCGLSLAAEAGPGCSDARHSARMHLEPAEQRPFQRNLLPGTVTQPSVSGALVERVPVDDLGFLDKDSFLDCLQRTPLGNVGDARALMHLTGTLWLLVWLTRERHGLPTTARQIGPRERIDAVA